MAPHLAYVFERFPSFTQTFCVREILELQRLGLRPLLFSIHTTADEAIQHFPAELVAQVHFLPQEKELVAAVEALKKNQLLPQSVVLTLRHWAGRGDKSRVYEAAYIGHHMRQAGVRHAHTHFAGIGARTCWWLRQFFGIHYSFTGHANDLFCEPGVALKLARLIDDAALVIAVSDFTAGWLRKNFQRGAKKTHRVYNGLDLAPIEQTASQQKKSAPPLILSVGRLIEKKGFDDLILAAAELRRRGLEFRCEIVGEGPLEEELRRLIETNDLKGHVFLTGPKPQAWIAERLGQATIFALPCVTEKDGGRDVLPTVIMEAMAASLPCVSTTLAGVPEMIDAGRTGLLCPERQPMAFATALESLLTDSSAARRMGEAGLAKARALFAKEKTATQLLALLISHGDLNSVAELRQRNPELSRLIKGRLRHRLRRLLSRRPPAKCAILPQDDGSISYKKEEK